MRLSSSFDIVQRFKFFINEFVGTQYGSAEECSQALHTFIEVSSLTEVVQRRESILLPVFDLRLKIYA
jgi:hypothetical protein